MKNGHQLCAKPLSASAWEVDCNHATKTVDWQFMTEDARINLKWLYPKI